jgi:hypothetical protein
MSNTFNPFAQAPVAPLPPQTTVAFTPPQAPAAPAQAAFAQAPVAPQPGYAPAVGQPSRGGLDDASNDGPGSPLMPHVAGRWRFKIAGYAVFTGHKSGPAVHISVQIVSTDCAQTPVGSTYRFMYKYDYVNDRPAQGNVGLVHLRLLRQFWQAVTRDPNCSVKANHLKALATDWSTTEVFVDAQAHLVPYQKLVNGAVQKEMVRNETWLQAV